MTVLVGRANECAVLAGAVRSALGGRGRLVLVTGPAGIGKSALADHAVVAAAADGMPSACGHAVDDPGAPPLWPWRRAVRARPDAAALIEAGSGPDAATSGPDPAARFRMASDVVSALIAHAVPAGLLLVLEDLHWADEGSLRLLRHLAGELEGSRIAVVGTFRDTADGPLSDVLPDLLRGDLVDTLAPAPLTLDQVAGYLSVRCPDIIPTVAQVPRLIHDRTGGNPLLVRLLADHLTAGGGLDTVVRDRPDLRRLMLARAADLDATTRAVVDAAALVGDRVPHRVLAAMTGLSAKALDDAVAAAVAAGVLVRRDGDVGFEHALVRDALGADLQDRNGPGSSAQLHVAAAEALAAAGAPAAPVAMHWSRAGPDHVAQVRDWAERADDEARRALAHDEAIRFAELALEAAEAAGTPVAEQARLHVRLASAAMRAGRFDDAVTACLRGSELAERASRPDLVAAAALAVHGIGVGVLGGLQPVVERALAGAADDDHVVRARLLAQLSVSATEHDDVERGRGLAVEALAAAERTGEPRGDAATAVLEALAARHLAIVGPETVRERLELGRRAVELGRGDGSPIAALWGHLWRGAASFQLGNLVQGEHEIDAIDRIARQRRSPLARWHHHRFRALALALSGDFAAARAENLAAFRLGERVDDISLTGMSYSFALAVASVRGDPGELLPGWDTAMRYAPPLPIVRISLPLGHAVLGDLVGARAEFAPFRSLPATMPRGVRWAGTMALVGRTALLLDDAETCAAVFEHIAPLASDYAGDGSGAVFSHGANAGFAADLARGAGRDEEALPLYRTAVAMNERIGARPWTALARLGWATSLRRLGRHLDGSTSTDGLLRDAVAEFRRLDMPGPLATALEELAADARDPLLTPRESEVAALVAEAMSNRDIAARLHLSERTVETHVRNILTRIDATRRTEIVAWWLRRDR